MVDYSGVSGLSGWDMLSLYSGAMFLATLVEVIVQGLRNSKFTKWFFGQVSAPFLSVYVALWITVPAHLQFFTVLLSAMQPQIPWYLDSIGLALVIHAGSKGVHEWANKFGLNRAG